jgi:tetratricopeptide (TPR) repeat protein
VLIQDWVGAAKGVFQAREGLARAGGFVDSKPAQATEQTRLFFVTPVWGINHLDLFLRIGLPSLLASCNLPGLSHPSDCCFLIYTRERDEERLTSAGVFRRLKALMPVEVHRILEPLTDAHRVMSDCHIDALRRVDMENAAAIFIPPDCVWANGGMARVEQLANAGKSMVHISGIRLDRDAVVPRLRDCLSADRCTLDIGARQLASLGLKHLHTIAMLHFWKEHDVGLMPANLYWTVPDEGLALRCFHLHPLMVKPQRKFARFNSTIDDDLGPFACPDETGDYVVTDSDEILTFELSGPERVVTGDFKKADLDSVAGWMEVGTNSRHHFLATHAIRVHATTLTEAKWQPVEREGEVLIARLREINRTSSLRLALRHPAVLPYRAYAMSLGRGRYSGRVTPLSRFAVNLLRRIVHAGRLASATLAPTEPSGPDPVAATTYQRLGNIKWRLHLVEGAIAEYTRAIGYSPFNAPLYFLRGRTLLYNGEMARAAEDFRAGLRLDPNNKTLLKLLQKAQGEDEEYEEPGLVFEGRRSWLYAANGTMRCGHPKWLVYRSLLPLLQNIIKPGYREVLLVGDYGYLTWQLRRQFPHVHVRAMPVRVRSLIRVADVSWDVVIWNDLDHGADGKSLKSFLALQEKGIRVVCVVASERRREQLAPVAREIVLLTEKSARFCNATGSVVFRTHARLRSLMMGESGPLRRLLRRALPKLGEMSIFFGLPLNGIGVLIRHIGVGKPSE